MQTITQKIPQSELDIVRKVVALFLDSCEINDHDRLAVCTHDEFNSLMNLSHLSEYEISVTLTKDEYDKFWINHGVEFPDYEKEKRLAFLINEYGQDVVDQVSSDLKKVGFESANSAYVLLKRYCHRECLINMTKDTDC